MNSRPQFQSISSQCPGQLRRQGHGTSSSRNEGTLNGPETYNGAMKKT